METRINAVHFDIAEKLTAFINKKSERLARRYPSATLADYTLKVVKPESAMNKEVILRVILPGMDEQVAAKTADSFEEAVDLALEAVDRQLEKVKNRK